MVPLASRPPDVRAQPLPWGKRSSRTIGRHARMRALIKLPIRSCSREAWKGFLKEMDLHRVGVGRRGFYVVGRGRRGPGREGPGCHLSVAGPGELVWCLDTRVNTWPAQPFSGLLGHHESPIFRREKKTVGRGQE